jgi:bifunctional DNA-binding transcriptional regulator/antitoxin component of YhaV-PrlF toxin-antitoxin module
MTESPRGWGVTPSTGIPTIAFGNQKGGTGKTTATIPHELREKYGINPGDEVVWMDTDEGIVVKKRTRTGGRGMLVPDDTSDAKREEIAEELGQRVRNRRDRNYEEV